MLFVERNEAKHPPGPTFPNPMHENKTKCISGRIIFKLYTLSYGFTLIWPCFFPFLCSSNSCKPNTQVDRNLVFTNALFTMCISVLFRCFSYPWVFRIMQAKWALIELHQLQVGVEGNFVWFVLLLPRRRPPHLSCSIDRSIHQTRHHKSWPSFAASNLLPCRRHPPQRHHHHRLSRWTWGAHGSTREVGLFFSAYVMHCLILSATLLSCSPLRLQVRSKLMFKLEF